MQCFAIIYYIKAVGTHAEEANFYARSFPLENRIFDQLSNPYAELRA